MSRCWQGGDDVDMDYWDSVLTQLGLARARVTLDTTYSRLRRRRTELCGAKPGASAETAEPADAGGSHTEGAARSLSPELTREGDDVPATGMGASCVHSVVA